MNRMVLGALAALMLAGAGIFWWQGRAATASGAPAPAAAPEALIDPDALPSADGRGLRGAMPPEATEQSREQRRFDRIDRDRDARITRNEMLAPRAAMFRSLDTDHNNLLSFEEWAVKTSNRFRSADANGDGALTRPEFATTKPKAAQHPQCRCAPARPVVAARRPFNRRSAAPRPPVSPDEPADDSADDSADPAQ